jgi:hypothetical protein
MGHIVPDVRDGARMAEVLQEAAWTERERAHRRRVERFLARHGTRDGEAHPVWDFLFSYYSLKPRQLRRWHPGYGVVLSGRQAGRYLRWSGYGAHPDGVTVTKAHLRGRADTVAFIGRLLRATAARPPRLNCFGLHEWAMVYRAPSVRHHRVPLRLGARATDAVVEANTLRCSHFDAFRFFTPAARPRNAAELTREAQVATEQPGCVHATMDMYKWCYKLGPLVDSQLLVDCLELAAAARELDMRASPYDLSGYGFAPIRIEEPEGRAEYVRRQHDIALAAAPLREALADACAQLTAAASDETHVTDG